MENLWQRSRSWDWGNITLKSSHRRCSVRKIFPKYTGKHLCQGLFFNKVSTLLKSKLWHRYSPVNFAKFLRTSLGTCLWTLLTGIFLGLGMGKSWTSADFNQVSSYKKPTSKYVTLYKWYKTKTIHPSNTDSVILTHMPQADTTNTSTKTWTTTSNWSIISTVNFNGFSSIQKEKNIQVA